MYSMVTIVSDTVLYTWKLLRVNKHSHQTEESCLCEVLGVFILILVSFYDVYVYQIITLCTLNIHNYIFQLVPNKVKKSIWLSLPIHEFSSSSILYLILPTPTPGIYF